MSPPCTEVQSASIGLTALSFCGDVWQRQSAASSHTYCKLPNKLQCAALQDVEDQLAELDVQEALGMQAPTGGRIGASAMNKWHPVGLDQVC